MKSFKGIILPKILKNIYENSQISLWLKTARFFKSSLYKILLNLGRIFLFIHKDYLLFYNFNLKGVCDGTYALFILDAMLFCIMFC